MSAIQTSHLAEFQVLASRSEFDIFDRNPDPALDELIEFAAVLSGANYAYIGWMDFNRLWFKAQYGFNAQEQPRSSTACQWVLKKGEPLLIRDAGQDQRFPPEGIPLIGAEPCRSYACLLYTSSPVGDVHNGAACQNQGNRAQCFRNNLRLWLRPRQDAGQSHSTHTRDRDTKKTHRKAGLLWIVAQRFERNHRTSASVTLKGRLDILRKISWVQGQSVLKGRGRSRALAEQRRAQRVF